MQLSNYVQYLYFHLIFTYFNLVVTCSKVAQIQSNNWNYNYKSIKPQLCPDHALTMPNLTLPQLILLWLCKKLGKMGTFPIRRLLGGYRRRLKIKSFSSAPIICLLAPSAFSSRLLAPIGDIDHYSSKTVSYIIGACRRLSAKRPMCGIYQWPLFF